jgi:hypothetical protein
MARRTSGFQQLAEPHAYALVGEIIKKARPLRAELDAAMQKLTPAGRARVDGFFREQMDEFVAGAGEERPASGRTVSEEAAAAVSTPGPSVDEQVAGITRDLRAINAECEQ